jgi:hypothetical protein
LPRAAPFARGSPVALSWPGERTHTAGARRNPGRSNGLSPSRLSSPGVVDGDIDIREQLAEARYIAAVAEIAGVRANRDVVAILDFPARAFEGSGTAGYEHKVTALSRKSISYRASNAPALEFIEEVEEGGVEPAE